MAVIVTSPQITAPCTEMWADPADLVAELSITEEQAEEAVIEATHALWALSGYKYHGYQCWREDFLLSPGQKVVTLPKWPVHEVVSVSSLDTKSVSASGTAISGWSWDGKYLHLNDYKSSLAPFFIGLDPPCPIPDKSRIRVEYRTAPYLPPGSERVAFKMATEYYKARNNLACNLPERITSVTRQGVSWTILDPQDFLQFGRTGIGAVDGWLAISNRFGITRAVDTLYAPIVLDSTQTGCGISCVPSDSLDGGSPDEDVDVFDGGSP